MLNDRIGHPQFVAAMLAFFVSAHALAAAWAFELIGGYVPCPLCLAQRVPYYVALPLLAVTIVAADRRWPACVVRGALAIAGLLFLYGLSLAVQQSGAEWGFWDGPKDCAQAAGPGPAAVGDLLKGLGSTVIVSCTEVRWRFLGLSFAGWNAVVMVTAASFAFSGAFARERFMWSGRAGSAGAVAAAA